MRVLLFQAACALVREMIRYAVNAGDEEQSNAREKRWLGGVQLRDGAGH
jgi:hypothetical protein